MLKILSIVSFATSECLFALSKSMTYCMCVCVCVYMFEQLSVSQRGCHLVIATGCSLFDNGEPKQATLGECDSSALAEAAEYVCMYVFVRKYFIKHICPFLCVSSLQSNL